MITADFFGDDVPIADEEDYVTESNDFELSLICLSIFYCANMLILSNFLLLDKSSS